MDPRQERGTDAVPSDEVDGAGSAPGQTDTEQVDPAQSGAQHRDGQSSGADLVTMGLFGVMVIIASVCFVIW